MALVRLYRLETPFGDGMYTTNPKLGAVVEYMPIHKGMRTVYTDQKTFKARGGHTTSVPIAPFGFWRDLLTELDYEPPAQLNLSLEFTGRPLRMPGISEIFSAAGYSGLGMDLDGDVPRVKFTGVTDRSDEVREAHQEQLQLDVTIPPEVVEWNRYTRSFTLADLLEQNFSKTEGGWIRTSEDRPDPRCDGIPAMKNLFTAWKYAFPSLKKLSAWCDGATPQQIMAHGGVIRVIDVHDPYVGKAQAIFKEANVVKSFNIINKETNQLLKGE